MLAESLPRLLQLLQKDGGNHEVIVVDNHSTDGTDEFIRRRFPEVRLVRSDENVYFAAGNRIGIAAANRDVLVLLNSDTIVEPGCLFPLLQALSDPSVFGSASRVLSSDETGNTHASFTNGQITWRHEQVDGLTGSSAWPVLWLHRGLFAVDRRKYSWLGGLDPLYDPLFMEDVDLSYAAWKAGWKCVLVPFSQVRHDHGINIPPAGNSFIHMLVRRNQYLFMWKNISSLPMLSKYVFRSSGTRLRRASLPEIGTWAEVHSFFAALKRLPAVMVRRIELARRQARTDDEVLDASSFPGTHEIRETVKAHSNQERG